MSAQLDRIHALAAERRANEGLYEFQRAHDHTIASLLCVLIGRGAIDDGELDAAIALVREWDARSVAQRAGAAS